MRLLERLFGPTVVLCGAAYLIFAMIPQRDAKNALQIRDFARVPVVDNGRVKPLDTLARISLMIISGRQTYYDENGAQHPAIQWLLDVMTDLGREGGRAAGHKVFRIENDQLLGLLDLKERPGLRYAFSEFEARLPTIQNQLVTAKGKKEAERDAFDNHVISFAEKVELYLRLANFDVPHMVPPQKTGGEWQTLVDALHHVQSAGAISMHSDAVRLAFLLREYRLQHADSFNDMLAEYRGDLATRFPSEVRKANLEVFFNHFAPFYQCCVLYVLIFVLAACGWMGWSRPLWRAAFWLLALVLLVHSGALIGRMYIQGRPPVTNLYSSAIFIGWAAVIFGLGLELIYRNGIGTTLAAVVGALTLWIAHNLGSEGDTMEMMRAVLDTNFWLGTHVVAVTLGYTATFVAGGLGIAFIVLGVFTPLLDREAVKRVGSMVYGVVCFAMLFSFVGTVLGGIWADQSWGRFWGWDPKENGAVLIVIWNALVLHARWGGMVRQRGVAVLAVGGNIVTSWSWFGVNMLGVGLHSYGFMRSAAIWMGVFWLSQLVIIAIGLLPKSMWMSYVAESRTPALPRKPGPRSPGRTPEPLPAGQA